ncbi:hypothetical protein [Thiofilum flexile]|uniref:hypothetical protein n=1 Tax=Thiofilum flexile TaxID=125627 RepID=UPI000376BFDD|nr:hypothetical protein [Thiofilum flexile]
MWLFLIPIISIILFFPTFWLFSWVVGRDWGSVIAVVAMFLAYPILLLQAWPNLWKTKDSMLEALNKGMLSSADYDVIEVVEVFDSEEIMECYFLLDIGGGRTLSLYGDYLFEKKNFPNSRIRIFWHNTEGYTFGIECLGNKIISTKRILIESEDDILGDRDIVDQPIARVAELLESRT